MRTCYSDINVVGHDVGISSRVLDGNEIELRLGGHVSFDRRS